MSLSNTENAIAPFNCQYTPQFSELLFKLNCSLAISTYQAGKLVFISPKDEDTLVQLPRSFEKPMGIALDASGNKLALACKDEITVFSNSKSLAAHYPKSPDLYDAMYMPRLTYHTGPLDIHDLSFGANDELYAVNTLFSCIIGIDGDYNFTPYWKPSFIDALVSEDRCHLNGMALQNGKPKYATAFGQGNTFQSWRETVTSTGVIFDIDSNQVIIDNLPMPHTPRLFGNELYALLSATGELIRVDVENGKYEVVRKLDGFVRGMSFYKDYLFIGHSKLRKNSSTFGKLDFAERSNYSGVSVVHLPTGSLAGQMSYQNSVDEIYDVEVIPDKIRPNILNTLTPDHKAGLMTPEATFWAKTSEN